MPDSFPKGKPLIKTHQPSRLRNEIRAESSDDGMRLEKGHIQKLHSDCILPETQPDIRSDLSADDGLDTADKAIIQRNAVPRTTKAVSQTPITPHFFQNPPLRPQDSQANPSLTTFSFTPANKGPGKPLPKAGAASTQCTTQAIISIDCVEQNNDLAGNSMLHPSFTSSS